MSSDLAEIEQAIYEQSFRTLDEQAKVLDGLQSRAGTLVGIANVATAFLGGLTLTRGEPTVWPAIALFLAVVLLGLFVLLPGRPWIFSYGLHGLLTEIAGPGPRRSLSAFRRTIVLQNAGHYETNATQLRFLNRCYSTATILLIAELMLWMWALAT